MATEWASVPGWYILVLIFGVAAEVTPHGNEKVATEVSPEHLSLKNALDSRECKEPYRKLGQHLSFNASTIAAVPPGGTAIGNGYEMQCRDSDMCLHKAPQHARCTRLGMFNGMRWGCNSGRMPSGLILTSIKIKCQQLAEDKYCVYEDSCVLLYSLRQRSVVYGYMIGVLLAVGLCLCITMYCCDRAQRNDYANSQVTRRASTSINSTPIILDRPPPYEYQPPTTVPTRQVAPPNQEPMSHEPPQYHSNFTLPSFDEDPPPYSAVMQSEYIVK